MLTPHPWIEVTEFGYPPLKIYNQHNIIAYLLLRLPWFHAVNGEWNCLLCCGGSICYFIVAFEIISWKTRSDTRSN